MSCTIVSLITATAFGIAFALFSYFDFLAAVPTALFMLITALVLVPITLFAAIYSNGRCCVCNHVKRLSLAITGAAAASVISIFLRGVLGATLAAIFTGFTAFALVLALGTVICITLCICS